MDANAKCVFSHTENMAPCRFCVCLVCMLFALDEAKCDGRCSGKDNGFPDIA